MKQRIIRFLKSVIRGTPRTPTDFAREILAGSRAVAADVGAAAGLQNHWGPLDGNAVLYLFEPFADAAAELEERFKSRPRPDLYRIMPVGLSDRGGEQTLHVTNTPSGSSLKQPYSPISGGYAPPDYFFPIRDVAITVARLDAVLDDAGEDQLDFIKLDTQGAEADILEGLGAARRARLVCAESEVNLVGAIPDGTSFGKLSELLTSAGLELFDLRIARGYRRFADSRLYQDQFHVVSSPKSISARAWEADVVWFRRAELVIEDESIDSVRRLALAYCLYHFFTEAWHLFDLADHARPEWRDEIKSLRKSVLEWHRYVRSIFPLDRPWLGGLVRRGERWQQYMWLPYPHS